MKTYQRLAAICIATGLLGGIASYGVEDAPHGLPHPKRAASAAEFFNLGQEYSRGGGVVQDDKEAAYCYRKSAELGDARAQISLGMMYANGRGVQKDFDQAIYWIRQASDLAQLSWHDAAVAQAVAWLQEASGHGYAPAQRTLELMESSGRYSGTGLDKSVFWFRGAIESGDAGRYSGHHRRPPSGAVGQVSGNKRDG